MLTFAREINFVKYLGRGWSDFKANGKTAAVYNKKRRLGAADFGSWFP